METMKVSFRSERTQGRGTIARLEDDLRIATEEIPAAGEPVIVMLLGADGIDQARILGVVSHSDAKGFRVRPPSDEEERGWIRRSLQP